MANLFLISDTHFSHANILSFLREDGSHVRNFSSVEEMDEHMVEKWNSVVRPPDHVYHLGDVVMHKSKMGILGRLNGRKRLILGNHEEVKMAQYIPYFQKIQSSHQLDNLLLTHIPVHPLSLPPKLLANVHGHVHNSVPSLHFGSRYFNISAEVLDYTPISLEELKTRILNQQVGL